MSKVIKAILKRAKRRGFVEIYTHHCEKWEDTKWDGNGNILPDTGVYDHEGHSTVDISTSFYPSILEYIKANLYGLWECIWYDGWHGRSIWWLNFRFRLPWDGWVWTINSFDSIKADMAMDMTIKETVGVTLNDKYEEFYSKLMDSDVQRWLDGHCKYIGCGYWILQNDETCFFVDEKYAETKFDLRDGWSNGKCAVLLSDWFYYMGYRGFGPVRYKEPDWLVK